uniref:Uncharacterized protein n=1 Tax=Equus asinus asinus TaxID=83772 RepID=A0A8C4MJI4_EQUAS
MWPRPYPPCPEMSEETRQMKLAAAKKKLKEYQKKNNLGPFEKKKKKIKNGSSSEITTSDGCHSPEDVSLSWPGPWFWPLAAADSGITPELGIRRLSLSSIIAFFFFLSHVISPFLQLSENYNTL